MKGSSNLVCNAGKLNADVPTCQDIDECKQGKCGSNSKCLNLPGTFKCSCLPGFKLHGSTKCVDVNECDTNNGNCQDKCVNTHGSYTCGCRPGYRISQDKHSCEDVNECASSSANNCMQTCVNERGSYKCQCYAGYSLSSDGTSCIAQQCSGIRAPVNGGISKGFGKYKEIVTYSCSNGLYRLNGPDERVCQANGKWSGRDPTCDVVNCGILPSPFNGQAKVQGASYHFLCLNGFALIGSAKRTCQTNGVWSGVQPRCVPKHCPVLSIPANGKLIGHSYSMDDGIMARCDEGYMLQDESSRFRFCQQDGTWTGKDAKCVALSCGQPRHLKNGVIQSTGFGYKDKLTYTCNSGYGISGNDVRTCQLNGQWSGIDPRCIFNSCGYPGGVDNGEVVGDVYDFGSTVTYKCNAGYRLVGGTQRTCLSGSGTWSGSKPTCQEILCPSLSTPANGEVTGTKRNVGSTVQFDCTPGYSIQGARRLVCGANGQWDKQPPVCKGGICGAAKLVGPSGVLTSPGFPNSYKEQQYCRSKIVVKQSKKAAINFASFKTESMKDVLELRDGKTGHLLYILSGVLRAPLQITSPSNELDVRFISDDNNALDGFSANYFESGCGGQITTLGSVIETPNYPSHYDASLSCSWQIIIPGKKFRLKFDSFETKDSRDTLEAWSSISGIGPQTKLGRYYGNQGSFVDISSVNVLYLKFTSDGYYGAKGFRATVVSNDGV